jgi:hypothetical protein
MNKCCQCSIPWPMMERTERALVLSRVGLLLINKTRRSLNKALSNRIAFGTPRQRSSGRMGDSVREDVGDNVLGG